MNNENRRRIINKAKAEGYQGSYVDLFKQAAQDPTLIAQTPEEKQAGLRPQHEAGRTDASMAFTDVPPNTPFNTVGMKAPIDIKKYDEQGHLVKSYENVPPGLTNIDSGPRNGTVLESPARMQEGGFASDNTRVSMPRPPEMYLNEASPKPTQTFLGPQPDISEREKKGLDKMFEADQKRREQIAKGVNPNTAFMTPPGLGADNEARAAYEYDNPSTSNIGQIAGGIGFLPIDRGLDIALTAAARSVGKGIQARRYKKFKSEVDWAKWNPDTPNHPSLMDEYKQIEFQTKKSGTWMKNADGSAYKGSPAQFIQENSSHFKKAFPEGANKLYRGVSSMTPIESDIGGGAVFTADENLARNYTGLPSPENVTPGTVNKFDVPLVRPQSTGEVIDGTGVYRGAMNLLQPKSKNKYSIVSEGDFWGSVEIGGKSKDWLAKQAKFKRETVIPQIKEKEFGDKFKAATIAKEKARADRFDYWGKWFDKITHRKPSGAPDFEDVLRTHQGAHIPKYGPKTKHIMTDDIGSALVDKDVNYGIMYGLDDGGMSKYVNIHNNKPGNYLKSRVGNVGFFDMSSSDIFKGLAPLGVGAGLMNKRQEGGFAQKRRSAQKGSVVDYLLPALESNNPTQFADTQLSNQTENIKIQQDNLRAEEQRVQDVRNNVIPTAQNLAALNKDIKDAGYFSDYSPHKKHFNKMRDPDTSPKEYKQLEKEAQEKYPELIEAIPENNVMMMNNQKYDADDELYCTPYGCYTYKKAGAKDVPEYSGNFGFVGGANKGENPFQKISADKAVSGDVGIMYEHVVNDYRDESKGMSLRPHHTAILSEKTDDPQLIKAYSAVNGERLNFMEGMLKAEDIKDKAGDTKEGRWDYYRYIGQTPRMQRNLSDSKHNQKQADLVSKALQKQAELSANMPKTENISMIDRRRASKIESENNSQDIVKSFETIPEVKKSNKQKVEQAANSVKGKIETAKQRKARVNAVRKKARAQTKAVRKGQ